MKTDSSARIGNMTIDYVYDDRTKVLSGHELLHNIQHVRVTAIFGWAFSLDRSSPASTKRSSGAILASWRVWGRWVADLARGAYLAF